MLRVYRHHQTGKLTMAVPKSQFCHGFKNDMKSLRTYLVTIGALAHMRNIIQNDKW